MKNEDIILKKRLELMEEGLLGSTGKKVVIETDEGKAEIMEPLPIHTYSGWMELGYRVSYGQHAIASFPIWKHRPAGRYKDRKSGNMVDHEEKMFLTKAFFFSPDQVERIIDEEASI